MMRRGELLALAAALPAAGQVTARRVEVETVFKSPGKTPHPNGLQATKEGLWVYDQTAAPILR